MPQNIAGLVSTLGGRQALADRLDRFTTELNAGPNEPNLWIGNEPGFGVPWLYNYLGQPWKTQQTVDRVRSELFGPTPDGEPGNDDLGALSSWYVWAALGLYPITSGTSTPHREHAAVRSRRDCASRRQIHPDFRPGRIERPEVHQRPDHRRPAH